MELLRGGFKRKFLPKGGGLNDSPAKPAKILENSRKNSDFFDFFLQNFPEVPNFSKNTIKIGAALRAARNFF